MEAHKIGKKEIFESWRIFFSLPLRDDLSKLLNSQFEYLMETGSELGLLEHNQGIEPLGNDLNKICSATADYKWTAGKLLLYNISSDRSDRNNAYSFRTVANYLQLNKNIRNALFQDLKDKQKENDFQLIIKRFAEIPRITSVIKHQRNLIEHQSQDIHESSMGYFLTFLGNITRLIELVYISPKGDSQKFLYNIENAKNILEKNIILNAIEEDRIRNEENPIFQEKKILNKKLTKKDLTIDFKIKEVNQKVINMSESITELLLNLDNNIQNNNLSTLNSLDTIQSNISKVLEEKINMILIKEKRSEKDKKNEKTIVDIEEDLPVYNTEDIIITSEVAIPVLQNNNKKETITIKAAHFMLSILRDKIKTDYKEKEIDLLGYENICQMPIIEELIKHKNIKKERDWKTMVDNIETIGKKYKRYSDHKIIMDEQLNLYWAEIRSILNRIELN